VICDNINSIIDYLVESCHKQCRNSVPTSFNLTLIVNFSTRSSVTNNIFIDGSMKDHTFYRTNDKYMKGTAFWNVTMCSPLKVNRRCGGTYCLHSQSWICRARHHSACHLSSCQYLAQLIRPWGWKRCSSETSCDFNRLHGVISQNISTLHNHHCKSLKSSELINGLSHHAARILVIKNIQ
jgi:hypothetical protein